MSNLSFRSCQPQDAETAVPLIYSSGPTAFDYVFCDRHKQESQEFLRKAFVRGDSEFGYQQHIAAVIDGTLVGVGAVRSATQNFNLMVHAFRNIANFYSPLATVRTLVRGLRAEQVIQPPKSGIGIIYHLGVSAEHRGCGIGRKLVENLLDNIRARNLQTAALDVAKENPRAKSLYTRMGFSERCTRRGKLHSAFGRVADHTYMELSLASSRQEG